MAIKGLTHQEAEFPEIGQLRKGSPKQTRKGRGGKEYEIWGKDLTYFRFTSNIPEVMEAFERAYDGEPRMINVFLPFQTTDENWEAWQEEYRAGGLVHRCDGETVILWQKDDGSYSTEQKPCPYENGKKGRTKNAPGCLPTGRLKVVIPELQRLAYVTVLTNSWHDIRNLDRQLRALENIQRDLRGIPLQLRRSPRMISTPGTDGKRARREKWLLSIEAAPTWVAYQLAAQQAAAVPHLANGSLPELPVPEGSEIVDGTTGEIVDARQDNGPDWDTIPDQDESPPPPEEPAPEPPAQPAKSNGNGRPLTAERVREVIRTKSGWQDGQRLVEGDPITDGQRGGLAALMNDALGGMPADVRNKSRHDILNYLIGVTSTNDLYRREATAMITWLKIDQEGEWLINEYAKAETAGILEAIAVEAGQQALPM